MLAERRERGEEGDAWTLVEDQEARHFKIMMREADHLDKLAKMKVTEADLQPHLPHYEVRFISCADGRHISNDQFIERIAKNSRSYTAVRETFFRTPLRLSRREFRNIS